MILSKVSYVLGAIPKRFSRPDTCPGCGSMEHSQVDRKAFHELRRCGDCSLLYRWPYETAEEMSSFYQKGYQQKGLTTDLPDESALAALVKNKFKNTDKDFSLVIEWIRSLGLPKSARILDYGANWGYGVYQFNQAGYQAMGFEISAPRAAYSRQLAGVEVMTDWESVAQRGPFDMVFSSHVLEHTPNPARAIASQMAVLSPGGWLMAIFPNGSKAFRDADRESFHRLWGRVHPVMLNDEFVQRLLSDELMFMGAKADMATVAGMLESTEKPIRGDLSGSEMLILARKKGAVVHHDGWRS